MATPSVGMIIQARMGSTRLPGKVMLDLLGAPMLQRQLERLLRCRRVHNIVVATSTLAVDDAIADFVDAQPNVGLYRGSEADVLSRYYEAAQMIRADVIVRITADCPLIDPEVVDRCIGVYLDDAREIHYASNCHERTYPRGLDTEVFSRQALEEAHHNAMSASEREHVTPYIWRQPERFPMRHVTDEQDHSDLRWTVDTPEDFELVRRIYQALYPTKPAFVYQDVLDLLAEHPEWKSLNRHVPQKHVAP